MRYPELSEEENQYADRILELYVNTGRSVDFAIADLKSIGISAEMLDRVGSFLNLLRQERNYATRIAPGGLQQEIADSWYDGRGPIWEALKESLRVKGTLSADDIDELASVTDEILNQGFRPPFEPNPRAMRGLILGHVQSGKTTNFLSVIAKAADSGYKLVVVLTGMNENLRRQTQRRIETQLVALKPTHWKMLTDSRSDFRSTTNNVEADLIGISHVRPVAIAVMKKNTNVLLSFYKWLTGLSDEQRMMVPMLIVDDEADQASPDAGKNSVQSMINLRIENIADPDFMPRNVYLGYTATPFANLFMDASTPRKLYPKDLIFPIKPGQGYFGAVELYGRDPIGEETEPITPELFVVRGIEKSETELISASGWKYDSEQLESDQQIIISIYWFILATACRTFREKEPNWSTMLVHTSSKTDDHFTLAAELRKVLADLKERVIYESVVEGQLETLWEAERQNPLNEWKYPVPVWAEIRDLAWKAIEGVSLKVDNFKSSDRIDFEDFDEFGVGVQRLPQIVVGGNTLSRGLTLEGLSVSYFMRSSKQYDTLLQMARWFGYRQGYEDLMRVWMPNYEPRKFAELFKTLALVEVEIREEIDSARERKLSPLQLPIRIRQLPGLQITRKAAMRFAVPDTVSYQGLRQEVHAFENDEDILSENLRLGVSFVAQLLLECEEEIGRKGYSIFRSVDTSLILKFLDGYHVMEALANDDFSTLSKYIKRANEVGELLKWNVYVATAADTVQYKYKKIDILDRQYSKIRRAKLSGISHLQIKTLTSKDDPIVDIKNEMITDLNIGELLSRPELKRNDINLIREHAFSAEEAPGLLGLYFIDKNSKYVPRKKSSKSGPAASISKPITYADLEALQDVLAVSTTIPTPRSGDLSKTYLKLDPAYLPEEDGLLEEENLWEEAEAFYDNEAKE